LTSVIPEILSNPQLVPTVIVYYGEHSETNELSLQITNRLVRYVECSSVQQVFIEIGDDVTQVQLPDFVDWFGPRNSSRYITENHIVVDRWQQLNVIVGPELRIIVCVLDEQMNVADLQSLYQFINNTYTNKGLANISITLMWLNEYATSIVPVPYAPQLYVNKNRVLDAHAVLEHAIVAWVTSNMKNALEKTIAAVTQRHTKKQISVIWLGAASIYVDLPFVMRVFRERIESIFMRGWLSKPVDQQLINNLRIKANEFQQKYLQSMHEQSLDALNKQGWLFNESSHPFAFNQTSGQNDNPSGFMVVGHESSKRIFRNAQMWWLTNRRVTPKLAEIPHLFIQLFQSTPSRDELNYRYNQDVISAVQYYLRDTNTIVRTKLTEAHEKMYVELHGYLVNQLFNYQNIHDSEFGLKRMINALELIIRSFETNQVSYTVHKQLDNKTVNILPGAVHSDEYYREVAKEFGTQIRKMQNKWVRMAVNVLSPWGMLLRLVTMYPLFILGLFAIFPTLEHKIMWGIVVLVILLIAGISTIIDANIRYQQNTAKDRDQFFSDMFTPFMIGMIASINNEYIRDMRYRLQRLHDIYKEIDSRVQNHSVVVPTQVNSKSAHTRYVIRNLPRIFGTRDVVIDNEMRGQPWDGLRGETIPCYEVQQQWRLSWVGRVKLAMNQSDTYPAEVTLLLDIASRLFEQRRQSTTAFTYMDQVIKNEMTRVASNDPVSVDDLVEDSLALTNGMKWRWLADNATNNVMPRNVAGITTEQFSVLVLSPSAQVALQGGTGINNPNFVATDVIATTVLDNEISRVAFEFDIK